MGLVWVAVLISCKKGNNEPLAGNEIAVDSVWVNGTYVYNNTVIGDVDYDTLEINILFDSIVDTTLFNRNRFSFSGSPETDYSYRFRDSDRTLLVITQKMLEPLYTYQFTIDQGRNLGGIISDAYSCRIYTRFDTTPKFPVISADSLLTLVEHQTFRYFWDFGHPVSGMTRERNTSGETVTSGGSGFGIMAIIVGVERGFISREAGISRLNSMLTFFETCDRYHGAWPHWINGTTGKTIPFSTKDDGADLVETSYVIQGLYTFRQYLDTTAVEEKPVVTRINRLIDSVDYDWFTQGQDVLYWHWSPHYYWEMDHQIRGYNETLITYIVAASSTTHTVSADVYHKGYARDGGIVNGNSYFGYKLPLGNGYGGPLFFTHFSFLGLDPRHLKDTYADYREQNVNQSLINNAYCSANPMHYGGYSDVSWGLTASDDQNGYSAHSPTNDLGVITPSAALSSMPYCPEQSLGALHHFYYMLGDRLWGEYGFHDAFNVTANWWANSYIAIDQGPIVIMIENYRTGLLWELFMSCPEVQAGLNKLGFSYE